MRLTIQEIESFRAFATELRKMGVNPLSENFAYTRLQYPPSHYKAEAAALTLAYFFVELNEFLVAIQNDNKSYFE